MVMAKSITHLIKYEKLKLQNHFLEMLTATVSHDMRTPLNAILGIGKNLELLVKNEVASRFLKIILNSARLLHFLVNDLIDLFRIRNSKFSRLETRVELKSHLDELIDIFHMQASEKGLKLFLECDPILPKELTLDIQRVKQILINLIVIALKFTF